MDWLVLDGVLVVIMTLEVMGSTPFHINYFLFPLFRLEKESCGVKNEPKDCFKLHLRAKTRKLKTQTILNLE